MSSGGDVVVWGPDATDLAAWRTTAAESSTARRSAEGGMLRLDFRLVGHGSWVIARRELSASLPAHYVAVLELSGGGGPFELQLKLVDPSSRNVWWWRRRDFSPAPEPARLVLRRASLEFAWGPASGGEPAELGAVEIGVAADRSTAGTLRVGALRIEARDPSSARPSVSALRASSSAAEHGPERVRETSGTWRPVADDGRPWLELDLGRPSEFGGVVIDFAAARVACRLLASGDGSAWTVLADAAAGDGRRSWLRTADGEGRFARIEFAPGSTPDVARAAIVPIELAVSPARYASETARRAPRGRYPRHLLGEQAYWAVVGADGDERKGLLSEDGALEIAAESFTLEPFLWIDGRLLTWADVTTRLSLAEGHLPIPTVEWEAAGVRLRITAFAAGPPGRSALAARYALRLDTASAGAARVRLFVAVRPFQVNPSWQSLNLVGGMAPITRIACEEATVQVNAAERVVAVTRPEAVGGAQSEAGLAALVEGHTPEADVVDDPIGLAEAAFVFDLAPSAGEEAVVALAVPWFGTTSPPPAGLDGAAAAAWIDERLANAHAYWRTRLARVPIELPRSAARVADTLRASVAWILVNREGPRIQPGPRCYRRSWIRDGTLTGTALTEMGFADEARAFLGWYAPFQLPDGRVPCAVDRRGVDQAVEHDSHGEFAWGVIEVFRLTGDRSFLRELWPHVRRAVEAIAALRAQRTSDAYRGTAFFGLLPESISHEGYASHPVHSYWDDFFAVRALADAAEAAALLGDTGATAWIAALRDAMRADLRASITRAIAEHGLDFVPGSAELGDFDPTSTAIALDPCGEASRLPPAALARTFERYWDEFETRRRGETVADSYSPYEIRTAAAFVMLGQKRRALELLEWLMADQPVAPWCAWPEIAWRDRRAPRFLGDLPHGWIASSFARAVRRMIAYERRDDGALVLAAGVPAAWVREAPGIRVRALPTHFGRLDCTLCADDDEQVRVTLGGDVRPPGGFVIVSPLDRPLRTAFVDGRRVATAPDRITLHESARHIVLVY